MNQGGATLLVVDDSEDNRYTLKRRLNREGYTNVLTANDGRQALEVLRSGNIDLLLLDIMMPEMNGYEVLEQLKLDADLRHMPVIMISAVQELDSVVRCIELGAEDYLAKPFNATLLRARVGASLEKKRLRDALRANLERLEQELGAARTLQLGMLPRSFPQWSPAHPVRVHALMEPAREVGGDLYDFFYLGSGRFCFFVGDVSGKGAPAAMFMARTRSLVRMAVELWQRFSANDIAPSHIAATVNHELCQNNDERMFVTVFLGFIDTTTGVMQHVNAGHPSPHVLRSSAGVARIDGARAAPLGVRRETAYSTDTTVLKSGDGLFVCSDGVTEAMNVDGSFFTEGRLEDELTACGEASPEALVYAVKAKVDSFGESMPKADDVTILALRWQPAQ